MKSRVKAFAQAIPICFVLTFVSTVSRANGDKPAAAPDNVIQVWSVGSPCRAEVPPTVVPFELRQQAQQLGYTIDVHSFAADGFAARLQDAVNNHTEPEFITFNNFGILIGLNALGGGSYQGVLETDFRTAASMQWVNEKFESMQPRGWTVLLRSAANYEAARALVMQPPQCQNGSAPTQTVQLDEASQTAMSAVRAYLGCDAPALASQSDEAKLGNRCYLPNVSVRVDRLQSCGVLGNGRLAFAYVAATLTGQTDHPAPRQARAYSDWLSKNVIGQQTVLAILRRQENGWRVLAISDDPFDTNRAFSSAYSTLPRLAGRLTNESLAMSLSPAVLTTADGARPMRLSQSEFENFEWVPSPSSEAVAQIAEFLVGADSSRERTRLFLFLNHEERVSRGLLWGAGNGGRWRVWSIGKAGDVSLTESRSYKDWW